MASALMPRENRTITPTAVPNEARNTTPRAPQSILTLTVGVSSASGACRGGGLRRARPNLVDVVRAHRLTPGQGVDPAGDGHPGDRDDYGTQRSGLGYPAGEGADDGCGGQGEQPGDHHLARQAPAHRSQLAAGASTEDRARADLGGRQREPQLGGDQDDSGTAGLGGESLRCLDLGDPLAQGPDDPPAADVGAQS